MDLIGQEQLFDRAVHRVHTWIPSDQRSNQRHSLVRFVFERGTQGTTTNQPATTKQQHVGLLVLSSRLVLSLTEPTTLMRCRCLREGLAMRLL